ncbi:hypothetical protein K503DRAFT_857807 [Rhizopogon vinicolor AM-OR11-026]|uniref:DUF6697 domain-containing protein n=1 Tax=Rhizopogon vinicolor AM-OR11-026 TaxID=1314800 RepID=A0A1B7MVW1_9AGAM|nr:hypothetical protein K503DRAFT_857807 [Rhizopogon vinicolor AM-OR11-026]
MTFSEQETANTSDPFQPFFYNDPVGACPTSAEHAQRMDAHDVAELTLIIEMERMRVAEVIAARDTVVHRLEDAYTSVRQKAATIDRLQREIEDLKRSSTPATSATGERVSFAQLPAQDAAISSKIQQPALVEACVANGSCKSASAQVSTWQAPLDTPERPTTGLPRTPPPGCRSETRCDLALFSPSLQSNYRGRIENHFDLRHFEADDFYHPNVPGPLMLGDRPDNSILTRQALLASLPLPVDIPDDALSPILIPPPFTLHEFLGNASGTLKLSLSNYRILGQATTYWCPEREEHGYLLAPVFKCCTNPRVTTAHRWTAVDVIGTMNMPTECFYNKDGKWYYAGVYEAFRMDDLTMQEWEALSTETTQALIRETLAGRKNVSPQNLYETGQLYIAGALRVACIGLQCVGFSTEMYRAVLEQATLGNWHI